ncbi:hypothetical protein PTKIN_Ptkin16aG0503500 [Pterospermum kingtungense]
MDSLAGIFSQAKPFLAVIFLQIGFAGMSIISKFALNQGMSQHVLVVYRHAIATLFIAPFAIVLDRKIRPKMTISVFVKILLLGLLELEKVNIRKLHSQAKILGTIVTVGGAMLMTLINGPMLQLPWTKSNSQHVVSSAAAAEQDPIKGALMIIIGCFCWAGFITLQAITLKSYPAELSLTALICLVGAIEGSIVALAMEAGNAAVWSIHLDAKFLAAAYSGVICSGIAYYVQGVIMKARGPVFVTAFNPLCMIIVAILSSFILSEILYLGRVIGAIIIIVGVYLVLWGKSKDLQSSDSDTKKAAPTPSSETAETCNQDFVVLDVTKEAAADESVKEKQNQIA